MARTKQTRDAIFDAKIRRAMFISKVTLSAVSPVLHSVFPLPQRIR